jgi:hypothetical protein
MYFGGRAAGLVFGEKSDLFAQALFPMKLSTLLLVGSLAVNAALAVVYFGRGTSRGSASRLERAGSPAAQASTSSSSGGPKSTSSASSPNTQEQNSTAATLMTGDLRAMAARLKATGFPPGMIRAIIGAQINERFKSRREQLALLPVEQPFWKTDSSGYSPVSRALSDPKFRNASRALASEQRQLLKEVLGPDAIPTDTTFTDYQARRYGNLPADKIEQLERLDQDYNDLNNEVSRIANRIRLPEDLEKLAILKREKLADLSQILSPAEVEDYLIRTAQTTTQLRPVMTAANATEEEFRIIYRLQSAYDEKYSTTLGGVITPELRAERQAAQAQVEADVRAAVGEARYAEFARASDREYQQLSPIAREANIPEAAVIQVVAMRENVLNESNRIFDDPSMDNAQKRAALVALAQNARAQAVSTLGPDVGQKYLQIAGSWLSNVERGTAMKITTSINGISSSSGRSLPPAQSPANAGTAQPPTLR